MSLDKVVEEILDRGKREADEILASADQERERMLSEVRKRAEELTRDRERQAEADATRQRQRETARAELEARKTALRAQKEVLDEVFRRASEVVEGRGADKELLVALVQRHQAEIADGVVRSNKRDAEVLRRLVKAEVHADLDCVGGFVIESSDDSRRIDLTYETFLADLWEDVIKEVADHLWPEG